MRIWGLPDQLSLIKHGIVVWSFASVSSSELYGIQVWLEFPSALNQVCVASLCESISCNVSDVGQDYWFVFDRSGGQRLQTDYRVEFSYVWSAGQQYATTSRTRQYAFLRPAAFVANTIGSVAS